MWGSKLMNTFMHGRSFFSFSISFPKLSIFAILRLYIGCKMWKITALTWEISGSRLVDKFHISAFPIYDSLYNCIGEHEITKLKFASNPEKRTQNKHKKTWMKWNDTHAQMPSFFCTRVTTTYRMKNKKSSTGGLSLEMSGLARAHA